MAFFDNLKDKAVDLAQAGVAKSKQLGEIAKLYVSNVGEEDAIKKAYIEIGKLYYAERGMAPEAAYAALCGKITAAKKNIEDNKSRIEELKREGDITDDDVAMVVEPLAVEDLEPETPKVEEKLADEPKAEDRPGADTL